MPPRRDEKRLSFGRFIPLILCLAATAAAALTTPRPPWLWAVLLLAWALTLLGLYDLAQRSHSVRRNYPITGNYRWLFESIRLKIRQYLIEGDNDEAPFSRSQRSLVYARSGASHGRKIASAPLPGRFRARKARKIATA